MPNASAHTRSFALRCLLWLLLGGWIGAWLCFGLVVAPTAFQQDRPAAGKIVGATLRRFGTVEIACGLVALGAALAMRRGGRWEKVFRPATGVLMLGLTLSTVAWVYPEAAAARDLPDRFAFLHRLSVILVASNILLGTAQLLVSAARLRQPDGA